MYNIVLILFIRSLTIKGYDYLVVYNNTYIHRAYTYILFIHVIIFIIATLATVFF